MRCNITTDAHSVHLVFEVASSIDHLSIILYNSVGQPVLQKNLDAVSEGVYQENLDLTTDISKGLYLLQLKGGSETITQKILLN